MKKNKPLTPSKPKAASCELRHGIHLHSMPKMTTIDHHRHHRLFSQQSVKALVFFFS
ncbi:hypothetical protein GYMLUDRAFT_46762 [Collybiopsis luxurians FD-317 M1]|uniref:Uncharacterized protein n=1 Tax=Collybiopsis luxurians FD-317 M1 TaxID=944289 RepID=A0A0D0BP56_9AGAR|nr:hypothetical protein GYMLUDRAFT_46762 [Collybiopsis luxurians FD-317 M1]